MTCKSTLLMLKHNQIHMESGGEWEPGSCELAKRQIEKTEVCKAFSRKIILP